MKFCKGKSWSHIEINYSKRKVFACERAIYYDNVVFLKLGGIIYGYK